MSDGAAAVGERDESAYWMRVHGQSNAALFPASGQMKGMKPQLHVHAMNPDRSAGLPGSFAYATVPHTSFDPDWPVSPDWPYVIRGLRGSLMISQVEFAAIVGLGRATVERWESGTAVPLRGDALQLLTLMKPHLVTPVQAGQLLNVAAAAVLPRLSQPTARYTGSEMINFLQAGKHDHRDIGRGLLGALMSAAIVLPIGSSDDELEDTYVMLAGQSRAVVDNPHWLAQLRDDVRLLSKSDRQFVLDIARRLAVR